jgi:predicted ferric reductase
MTSHFFESSPLIVDVQRQQSDVATVASLRKRALVKAWGVMLIGSFGCAGAGVGLGIWHESSVFHTPNYNYGYSERTFFGLLAFTALSAMSFTWLYSGVRSLVALCPRSLVATFLLVLLAGGTLATGIVGGAVWGEPTLKCFAVFCVNANIYIPNPTGSPTGVGWLAVVGISGLIALSSIGLTILHRVILNVAARACGNRGDHFDNGSTGVPSSQRTGLHILLSTVLFVALGGFGLVTLYLPDTFQTFGADGIAANAMVEATENVVLCNNNSSQYTCPEVSTAVFRTSNWRWSTNLVLRLYPSNVIFYLYLLSLVAFVAIVRSNRRGRLFLKKQVVGSLSVGELLLGLWTLAMVSMFFFYWIHDHNFNFGFLTLTKPEYWARSCGQLAVVLLSLLFFPASRHSVLHAILGSSWEASLWAHRVLGYGVLAATFAHMVCWYRFYDINGTFPQDVFHLPMTTPIDSDNFTIALSTLAAWTLFLCMGVFALAPIRRKFFELFYYLHLFAAYLTIPAVLWHATSGWEYLIPGLTVWFMDRMLRLSRSGRPVELIDAATHADCVTELRFRCAGMKASPGQYVFLNIPELSLFEWHPFTLSTGNNTGDIFSVHIRDMGTGTWTGRLLQLVKAGGSHSLTLSVDGPCGQPLRAEEFKKIVLVAGGIGITPCASIYSHLKTRDDISASLIWALRESDVAQAFVHHFARNSVKGVGASNVKIFLTSGGGGMSAHAASALTTVDGPVLSEEVQSFRARPSIAKEIDIAAGAICPDHILVFACGPESLMKEAANAARQLGAHFHQETFLL